MTTSKKNLFIAILVTLVVIALISVFYRLQGIAVIHDYLGMISAILLTYSVVIVGLLQKDRFSYLWLEKESTVQFLKTLSLTCLVVFPAAFVANHFYQKIAFHSVYDPGSFSGHVWFYFALNHFVVVAFPEEFFFRGYLQKVFHEAFLPRWNIFGARMGWSTLIVCLLFAFSHTAVVLQWWHGLIFFPSLVFAWLRERTGTIWASVFFHWLCNLFSFWVAQSYTSGPV